MFWESYGRLLQVCVRVSNDFGGRWSQTLGDLLLQVHVRANFVGGGGGGGGIYYGHLQQGQGVACNRWALVQVRLQSRASALTLFTMFSKAFFIAAVKTQDCVVKCLGHA